MKDEGGVGNGNNNGYIRYSYNSNMLSNFKSTKMAQKAIMKSIWFYPYWIQKNRLFEIKEPWMNLNKCNITAPSA